MKGQWTLKFIFKSNENPWKGEFTNYRDMTEEQAKDWYRRYQEQMPEYYIDLTKNW